MAWVQCPPLPLCAAPPLSLGAQRALLSGEGQQLGAERWEGAAGGGGRSARRGLRARAGEGLQPPRGRQGSTAAARLPGNPQYTGQEAPWCHGAQLFTVPGLLSPGSSGWL